MDWKEVSGKSLGRQEVSRCDRNSTWHNHKSLSKPGYGSDRDFALLSVDREACLFCGTVSSNSYVSFLAAAVRGILSMSKQCNRCSAYISSGESGVFTQKGGDKKCWHPQCFACNFCSELLVDHIYFYKHGQVYCGRHYSELIKPRCGGCDEVSSC